MGIYIEYVEWMGKWKVFGNCGDRFYDTEKEARDAYDYFRKVWIS